MVELENLTNQIEILAHKITIVALITLAIIVCLTATKAAWPLRKKLKLKKLSGLKLASWKSAAGLFFGKTKFGRIVYSRIQKDGRHTFIMGGSGSGKTSCCIIPTLLHFLGNFFAVDVSGDISAAVPSGNSIVLAPCESDSAPYNIFGLIDNLQGDFQAQCEQLEKLAFLIMPNRPNEDSTSRFFTTEGRKILSAALIAFYFAGLDFSDICKKIISSNCSQLFREIDSQKIQTASLLIKGFAGTNEENTNGCKQSLDAAIKLFATNHNIQNSVHRPLPGQIAYTPDILEKKSVFFRIPESLLDLYAPLLNIIVSQTFAYFADRPIGSTPSILLALDEFVSLEMDSKTIVGALQRFRKRNISIMVVSQSIPALDRIYGSDTRKDMLNNFAYKVILHAGDADSQNEIAKMIGHKQEKSYSKTTGKGSSSLTEKEEKIWAIDPEDLSRLGDELVLIHPSGYKRLQKAPYYKYKTST